MGPCRSWQRRSKQIHGTRSVADVVVVAVVLVVVAVAVASGIVVGMH